MPINYTCIIVDDELDAIELLSSRLHRLYENIHISGTYTRWEDALEALRTQKFDMVFMDISMPGKSGINVLELLPNLESEIIFVTAHDNYALEAYSVSATGYILKPIDDNDLSNAIDKALERSKNTKIAREAAMQKNQINDKISISSLNGIDFISIKDILYLESSNKCTRIVTTKGEHISSYNLGKFQILIDKHSFYQVHRSYVVNLNRILRYELSGMIIMADKTEIPLSRNAKNDFNKIFGGGL